MESAKRIARRFGLTRSRLNSILNRNRAKPQKPDELAELQKALKQLHDAFVQSGGLPIPPPHLQQRVAGHYYADFIANGAVLLNDFEKILEPTGRKLSSFHRVLDFGCSAGRIIRAFHYQRVEGQQFYGTDIEAGPVEWCSENYKRIGEFSVNEPEPPLKYSDDFFDFVYAVSVFTHLTEDSQFRWLAELKRIVQPGSLLILSFHGPYCHRLWLSDVQQNQLVARGFLWTEPDRAYHTHQYIRENWSNYFDVLELREQSIHGLQDSALCRVPYP